MTGNADFRWLIGWLGAAGAGLVTLVTFVLGNRVSGGLPVLAIGLILLAAVVALTWWAYQRGRKELAVGVGGGYALLSLISGGQCTLLTSDSQLADGQGALAGFFGYPLLLAAVLLIGLIWTGVRRITGKGSGDS